MPGTVGSGNRGSAVAQQNSSGPHAQGADSGRRAPARGQWGQLDVAAEPAAGAGFSFERAAKVQCVKDVKYALPEQCEERTYWSAKCADALRQAAGLADPAPKTPLLLAAAAAVPTRLEGGELEEVLKITTVEYAQLLPCANPDRSMREEEKQDVLYVPEASWENYKSPNPADATKPKSMAQAPQTEGGRHYLVTNARAWPWTLTITGMIELGLTFCKDKDGEDVVAGEIEYGWSMTAARRSKPHCYQSGMGDQDWVIMIQVGEINPSTNRLVAWQTRAAAPPDPALKEIALGDKTLREALFWQINASGQHFPGWRAQNDADSLLGDDDPLRDMMQAARTTSVRFQLEERDGCMAYSFTPPKASEPVWTSVCDFVLVKMEGLYQFVEDDAGTGYIKILCRSIIDDAGSGTVLLKADATHRTPNLEGKWSLDVEVLVQPGNLKSNADVKKLFQSAHMRLNSSIMTPDMLSCWITEQQKPTVTSCIVRFGRQHDSSWVSGNCAWRELKLLDHVKAKVCVIPQYFKDSILPLPKHDYPRHIIIPQDHVRYIIGVNFWTQIMPRFFLNNKMAAKAVFALGVAGLFASKIWGGQTGFGHGMPFGWIYSKEPSTGKTEAMLALNSMLGFNSRSPWAGDCTKSAMFERLHQQTDLTVCVDDVVINGPDSKVFAQLGRAIYDRTSRAVTGKIRRPYSSALFTANQLINEIDKAFQSRYLLIEFTALEAAGEEDPNLFDQWIMIRELLSALTMDFSTLHIDGKIDREAMQDCATFLQAAIGRKRDRNANMWAILLYFLLQINIMFQCGKEDQDEVFEWMVKSVTRSTYELNNHQSILDQLVLCINQVMSARPSPLGRDDEIIFWHNRRTNCSPHAAIFVAPGGQLWYAFRMDLVVVVIKKILNRTFSLNEVLRAVDEASWAKRAKCQFYDCASNTWPIAHTVQDDTTNTSTKVPLSEDELTVEMLKEFKAVFFKADKFDDVLESVERGGNVETNYKDIKIISANPECGEYNFYKAVSGHDDNGWFGYRVLGHSSFGKYCCMTNQLSCGGPTTELELIREVELENQLMGFGNIQSIYQPAALLEFFNYSFPAIESLPPGYLKIPFGIRNDEDDVPLDYSNPPWREQWYGPGGMGHGMRPVGSRNVSRDSTPQRNGGGVDSDTHISPRRPRRRRDDDEQSSGAGGPSTNRRDPGSTPLGDATMRLNGSPDGPSQDGERPLKRRRQFRGSRFLAQEAEAEGEEDDEEEEETDEAEEDDGFINDEEQEDTGEWAHTYTAGECNNVIFTDPETGADVVCGAPCNPNEQLCHDCRVFGHRMTGLL